MDNLKQKAIKKYLADPTRCPYCGSGDMKADRFEPGGQWRNVACAACRKTWQEIFRLVAIAGPGIPDPE